MNSSDTHKSVWYQTKWLHSLLHPSRSFIGEEDEEDEDYDEENSRFAYERFLVWRDECMNP